MSKRELLRALLHDIAVAVLAGLAVAAGLFAVFLLAGLLLNGFGLRAALVVARGGLLVAGALELFVCAGLLVWRRGGERIRDNRQWKRRFQVIGLFPVLLVTAAMVLTAASLLDYYLYF